MGGGGGRGVSFHEGWGRLFREKSSVRGSLLSGGGGGGRRKVSLICLINYVFCCHDISTSRSFSSTEKSK